MKKRILDELLDRYERSRAFREGASARRIQADVSSCRTFSGCFEDGDAKREFLSELEELREEGLVDYSWVRFEKGNLVDKIYLQTDPSKLQEAYRIAGRISGEEKIHTLERQLHEALEQIPGDVRDTGDIPLFLRSEIETIRDTKKIPRFFFDGDAVRERDVERNGKLLLFLSEISRADEPGEMLERVMSTRLFGDSKYFEHEIKTKALSILRHLKKCSGGEALMDDQLLAERGIFRWPEILEFRGRLLAEMDDGSIVDYSGQLYGAYINGTAVRHVKRVSLKGISRIISIENKANYVWYLENRKQEEELVLYHGGFFSPAKGQWFRMIAEAAGSSCRIDHWSDIDLGGFRIFQILKRDIFPKAEPFRMDVETLEEYKERCLTLGGERYRGQLEKCLDDPEYACFRDVISYMLRENVRLEQETEIWQVSQPASSSIWRAFLVR